MFRHTLRSLLLMIPTIFGIMLITFIAIRLLPGDAVSSQLSESSSFSEAQMREMRAKLGLDQPPHVQFIRWLGDLARGDFGVSFSSGQPVYTLAARRIPVTLELAVLSIVIGVTIAIPIGIMSALYQDSWTDHLGRMISVTAISVPNFVIATLFIVVTSIYFRWQPPPGYKGFTEDPWVHLQQVLPAAIVLGAHASGVIMRMARSAMLEVLRHDYVRTARAKGLADWSVALRHALPNALVPVISVATTLFALALGGVVIVETIFSIPGMGSMTVQALFNRDYPQLMFNVLFLGLAVVAVNFCTDFIYAAVDPRIRYS